MPPANATAHTTTPRINREQRRTVRIVISARGVLRPETADVVDEVPDVGVAEAALDTLHLEIGASAVGDHGEDLAVAGPAHPGGVGEVGRLHVLRRELAVAVAGGT